MSRCLTPRYYLCVMEKPGPVCVRAVDTIVVSQSFLETTTCAVSVSHWGIPRFGRMARLEGLGQTRKRCYPQIRCGRPVKPVWRTTWSAIPEIRRVVQSVTIVGTGVTHHRWYAISVRESIFPLGSPPTKP